MNLARVRSKSIIAVTIIRVNNGIDARRPHEVVRAKNARKSDALRAKTEEFRVLSIRIIRNITISRLPSAAVNRTAVELLAV